MKDRMPTWPQMLVIVSSAATAIVPGYMFAHMRAHGERVPAAITVLFVLGVVGFVSAMFFLYFRPRYGRKSFGAMAAFFLFHLFMVLLLMRIGIIR